MITLSSIIHNSVFQIDLLYIIILQACPKFPNNLFNKIFNWTIIFLNDNHLLQPYHQPKLCFRKSLSLCLQMFRKNPSQNDDECGIKHQLKSSVGVNWWKSIEVSGALLPETDSKPLGIFSLTSLGFGTAKDLILQETIDKTNKVGSCGKCGRVLLLWSCGQIHVRRISPSSKGEQRV